MKCDGVIDIPLIRGAVEAASYADQVEGEIFSHRDWWSRPPNETLSIRAGRLQTPRAVETTRLVLNAAIGEGREAAIDALVGGLVASTATRPKGSRASGRNASRTWAANRPPNRPSRMRAKAILTSGQRARRDRFRFLPSRPPTPPASLANRIAFRLVIENQEGYASSLLDPHSAGAPFTAIPPNQARQAPRLRTPRPHVRRHRICQCRQ